MKQTTYSPFWEGTNIPKSKGNAFDWKDKESKITKSPEIQNTNRLKLQQVNLKQNANKNITYC